MASVMSRPASFNTIGTIGHMWLMVIIGLWFVGPAFGKAPGKRHCYRSVCVKVLTVEQVQGLLGKTVRMTASHYGDPSVDPFNRGTFTSNGERFNANDPTRTASATLPDGTELLLRNPDTGAVSHVRVNDFGPFWVNRELDVTEQVARDLGFEKLGIKSLEVTIVTVPMLDDVQRLYRRDRPLVPTMGYLGRRTAAETAKLAQVLMRRGQGDVPTSPPIAVAARQDKQVMPAPTVVKQHVYHIVSKQQSSPRALGAEDMTLAHEAAGAAALAEWNEARLARSAVADYAFLTSGLFVLLALLAPHGAPLLWSGLRNTHRYLTYDAALEHLRLMLSQEHPTAPARLAYGRLLQLPAPPNEQDNGEFEAEVVITTSAMADAAVDNILHMSGHPNTTVEPVRENTSVDRAAYLVRIEKRLSDAPVISLPASRATSDDVSALHSPKGSARIIGEGVCHEGDLSSAGVLIISGQVNGNVSAAQVVVEPTGTIDGDVFADWVELEGWINGDVVAQKVDLEPSALVSGQVYAKIINSSSDALIEGKVLEAVVERTNSLTEPSVHVN